MVIRCPSMYTFGENLKIKIPQNFSTNSTVSINISLHSLDHLIKFIHDSANEFNDFYFVPQWMKELEMVYGLKNSLKNTESFFDYPTKPSINYYTKEQYCFFTTVYDW